MSIFLTPLRRSEAQGLTLRNERTGLTVADTILPALDSESRRTGLLRHTGLPPATAMVIAPTNAIHTFFMKFPIDVAFVARDGRIVKVREALGPWRIAAAWGGYSVVEMAAGALRRTDTRVGDTLSLSPSLAAPEPH